MVGINYSRYYNKWHDKSEKHRNYLYTYYSRILTPHLPADRTISILDIGCGMGFTLWTLEKLGYSNNEGIDTDPDQIQSCNELGINAQLVTDTVDFLSNKKKSYDLIILLDVLEHIPHIEQIDFLYSCYHSLKEKGRLICTVPNANSTFGMRWQFNDWTHHSSFTEYSLDFVLFNAGFSDIFITETEFFSRPSLITMIKGGAFHWSIFKFCRFFRRMEAIGELGLNQGLKSPLSLNLIGIADK